MDQALDLPPAQRAAWLVALGPDDQGLKEPLARLIEQAGDDAPDPRFDALPTVGPSAAARAEDAPELPPDIGPYRPLRLLGEGGMSRVWLAERTDVLLNRPVALKLPRATWRDTGLALRNGPGARDPGSAGTIRTSRASTTPAWRQTVNPTWRWSTWRASPSTSIAARSGWTCGRA